MKKKGILIAIALIVFAGSAVGLWLYFRKAHSDGNVPPGANPTAPEDPSSNAPASSGNISSGSTLTSLSPIASTGLSTSSLQNKVSTTLSSTLNANLKVSPYEGRFVKGTGKEVYLVQNGYKRYLVSEAVGAKYGYSRDKIVTVTNSQLTAIPTGAQIAS